MSASPKKMSISDYATYRGVTRTAVQKQIREGVIFIAELRGNKKLLDVEDTDQRWPDPNADERDTPKVATLNDQKIRKAKADAEITEMKLAEMRGELIPATETLTEVGRVFNIIRTNFLALPSKLAQRVAILDKPEDCQQAMLDEVNEILEALINHESKSKNSKARKGEPETSA